MSMFSYKDFEIKLPYRDFKIEVVKDGFLHARVHYDNKNNPEFVSYFTWNLSEENCQKGMRELFGEKFEIYDDMSYGNGHGDAKVREKTNDS